MAELPSGSNLINAQFWEAPDGTWWEYLNSTKRFVQRPTMPDLVNAVAASASKASAVVVPATGQSKAVITETINKLPQFAVANYQSFRVGTEVLFNSSTGEFDFSPSGISFFGGDKVWAIYQNSIPEQSITGVIILQKYVDIVTHPTWGGNKEITYYILTDFQNMRGKKGAYKYVPGFTPTPAQIAINFND